MNKMNMLIIFIGLCIILCSTANALPFNCTGNSDCQIVDLIFANRGYVAWSTELPTSGQVLTAWNSSALYWSNITAPNGSIGPAGINGTNSNITNITNNGDGTYNWTFNTGYVYKTGNLTGPIGITGNTGSTGPSGLNGTNGINGTDLSANVSKHETNITALLTYDNTLGTNFTNQNLFNANVVSNTTTQNAFNLNTVANFTTMNLFFLNVASNWTTQNSYNTNNAANWTLYNAFASLFKINYTSMNTTTNPQNASNLSSLNGTVRLYNLSVTLPANTLFDIMCNLKIASAAVTTGQELIINYTNPAAGPINATISDWVWTKMATATTFETLNSFDMNGSHLLSTGSSALISNDNVLSGYVQTNGNITTVNFWLASEIAGSQVNITRGSNCISRKI